MFLNNYISDSTLLIYSFFIIRKEIIWILGSSSRWPLYMGPETIITRINLKWNYPGTFVKNVIYIFFSLRWYLHFRNFRQGLNVFFGNEQSQTSTLSSPTGSDLSSSVYFHREMYILLITEELPTNYYGVKIEAKILN